MKIGCTFVELARLFRKSYSARMKLKRTFTTCYQENRKTKYAEVKIWWNLTNSRDFRENHSREKWGWSAHFIFPPNKSQKEVCRNEDWLHICRIGVTFEKIIQRTNEVEVHIFLFPPNRSKNVVCRNEDQLHIFRIGATVEKIIQSTNYIEAHICLMLPRKFQNIVCRSENRMQICRIRASSEKLVVGRKAREVHIYAISPRIFKQLSMQKLKSDAHL